MLMCCNIGVLKLYTFYNFWAFIGCALKKWFVWTKRTWSNILSFVWKKCLYNFSQTKLRLYCDVDTWNTQNYSSAFNPLRLSPIEHTHAPAQGHTRTWIQMPYTLERWAAIFSTWGAWGYGVLLKARRWTATPPAVTSPNFEQWDWESNRQPSGYWTTHFHQTTRGSRSVASSDCRVPKRSGFALLIYNSWLLSSLCVLIWTKIFFSFISMVYLCVCFPIVHEFFIIFCICIQ